MLALDGRVRRMFSNLLLESTRDRLFDLTSLKAFEVVLVREPRAVATGSAVGLFKRFSGLARRIAGIELRE